MSQVRDELQDDKRLARNFGVRNVYRLELRPPDGVKLYCRKNTRWPSLKGACITLEAVSAYKWRCLLEDDPESNDHAIFYFLPSPQLMIWSQFSPADFGAFRVKKDAKHLPMLHALVLASSLQ